MPNSVEPVHSLRVAKYFEDQHLTGRLRTDTSVEVEMANVVLKCDLSNPSLLRISATWDEAVSSAAEIKELFEIASSCNAARFTPKAYTVHGEVPGTYSLGAEATIPIASGLSEEQFYSFFETSTTAIIGLFAEIDLRLPHLPPEAAVGGCDTPTGAVPTTRWRPGFTVGDVLTVVEGSGDG